MNNIKLLRVEKNLSQDELAKQVHITQTAVSQWEKGKTNPDMNTAKELAEFFEVTIDYLLGRSEERTYSYHASNIKDSQFVQGNGSVIIGSNFRISKEEAEILRIYRLLDVRDRAKLISVAFELEDKSEQKNKLKSPTLRDMDEFFAEDDARFENIAADEGGITTK